MPRNRDFFHAATLNALCWLGLAFHTVPASGAGVTIITHGFSGNVTDWIIPMANKIPGYPSFPGMNYSCYEISVTKNGQGQFVASQIFLGGTLPTTADSGEIL